MQKNHVSNRREDISAHWDGVWLKFVIPKILPHFDWYVPLEKPEIEERYKWIYYIRNAYNRLGLKLKFDKMFCLFITYHSNKDNFDLSNLDYKYVIDGLDACLIIKNDSWKHFEYATSANFDPEYQRTEIYVSESKNINDRLNYNYSDQLKLVVNNVPPYYSRNKTFSKLEIKIREYEWFLNISKSFKNSNNLLCFINKPFVQILIFHNLKSIWDIDNRDIKCVMNGLLDSKIIKSSNWTNLEFMISGNYDNKNPRTEIYISSSLILSTITNS